MASTDNAQAESTPAPSVDKKKLVAKAKPSNKPKKKELSPEEAKQDRLNKFKAAADIVHEALKILVNAAVEGASIQQLCTDGDAEIVKLTDALFNDPDEPIKKGNVNNVVSHFSPIPSDEHVPPPLAKGDVVKIQLGAHFDGYAAVQTETLIVGATAEAPAEGRQADVVKAAWHAAQIAVRQLKVDEKNWTITETVGKVAAQWDCMLSCEHTQGSIDGKKRIILNPTPEQRSGHEKATFAEGDVFGIDVLVSSGADGKVKPSEGRASVHQRVGGVNYQLKLKTSKALVDDVEKRFGNFPFNIRACEDEKRARVGILEGSRHGVFRPFEVTHSPKDTYVAAFMFTVLVTSEGPQLLSNPPVWYAPEKLKTEKELQDDDLKKLLSETVKVVPSPTLKAYKPKRKPRQRNKGNKDAETAEASESK
ncbi:Curved DNA-binding protein (42 kDa protein) [Tulasnella sp. 403]|nr:Curved DNA-binding protein (42 kDa protein) [Tulasnella sp. 403]